LRFVMRNENLPARSETIGLCVMRVFDDLVASFAIAGDARGLGAMRGIEARTALSRISSP